jgi:hypothetical protein
LQHVGIVIHDENVRWIHCATYLHSGNQTGSVSKLLLGLSASAGRASWPESCIRSGKQVPI